MKKLSIDRIELTLRGASRHRAQELAGELPRSLLPMLSGELPAEGGRRHLARIDAAPVTAGRGDTAGRTAAAVAASVAAALREARRRGD
jgi:hypothetical protein